MTHNVLDIQLATGVRLSVTQAGSGPDILLLHGTGGSGRFWGPVLDTLVNHGYRVTAPDGRGHGLSDRAASYQQRAIVDDGLALIDALGLQAPIVIGHSMGGTQALQMACEQPHRISRVILEDPAILLTGRDAAYVARLRAAWRNDIVTRAAMDDAAIVALQRQTCPRWSASVLADWAWQQHHTDPDVLQWLDALQVPVLDWLVALAVPVALLSCEAGQPGAVVDTQLVDALAERLPDYQSVVIPGVGHYMRHDDFDAYVRVILSLLPR